MSDDFYPFESSVICEQFILLLINSKTSFILFLHPFSLRLFPSKCPSPDSHSSIWPLTVETFYLAIMHC